MEGDRAGGGGKIVLWKGFPNGLVADQQLGAADTDEPQTAGAEGEVEATKDEGWLQHWTAGLVPKTTGWLKAAGWPPTMAPGTMGVDWLKTMGGLHGAAWGGDTGTAPRLARGVAGLGTLVLKRSRGLACGAADCPVGDVWPGGSETGGAKMSDASKSFAED